MKKIIIILAALLLCQCFPYLGDFEIEWDPRQGSLYINDDLVTEPVFSRRFDTGKAIKLEFVVNPDNGWVFDAWEFIDDHFFFSSAMLRYEENPFIFTVSESHETARIDTSRFSVIDFTVSPDGNKVFFKTINTGKKNLFLYDRSYISYTAYELPEQADFDIDNYGRIFLYNNGENNKLVSLFNWEDKRFEEFDSYLPVVEGSSYGSEMSWSPDLSKCAFLSKNENYEFSIYIYDKTNSKTIAIGSDASQIFEYPCGLMWSPDSSDLYFVMRNENTDLLSLNKTSAGGSAIVKIMEYQKDYSSYFMNIFGPDSNGDFYYSIIDWDNDYIKLYKFCLNNGAAEEILSFTGQEDKANFSIYQYGDNIYANTSNGVYILNGGDLASVLEFSADGFAPGDKALRLGMNSAVALSKIEGEWDLYYYNDIDGKKRITTVPAMKELITAEE